MIEPLPLKSLPFTQSNIITAAQLLAQFTMKSPTQSKTPFIEQSANPKKSFNRHQQSTQSEANKRYEVPLQRLKDVNLHPGQGSLILKKESRREGKQNNSNQSNIIKAKEVKAKRTNMKLQLPFNKIPPHQENECIYERQMIAITTQRPHALKMNINLANKAIRAPSTSKSIKEDNFFRKMSVASTLSLKTKHTQSLQQFDDDNDLLFLSTRDLAQSNSKQVEQSNLAAALQTAKKRLYQLIYSLDKRLLNEFQDEKEKGTLVSRTKKTVQISLRKKEMKTSEQHSNIQ